MAKTLEEIESRLAARPPLLHAMSAKMSAAVALVLRAAEADMEALFIRRALHDADPWSGHLAFPGGRIDETDADARAAAERESLEEVGIDLVQADVRAGRGSSGAGCHVRRLGRLDDVLGYAESIRVSAFVYGLTGPVELKPNYEVHEVFWTPLRHCTDPDRQAIREFEYLDVSRPLPTIRLLEDERAPVLWGITYKFMDDFMARIGRPIPFMPWEADQPAPPRGRGVD